MTIRTKKSEIVFRCHRYDRFREGSVVLTTLNSGKYYIDDQTLESISLSSFEYQIQTQMNFHVLYNELQDEQMSCSKSNNSTLATPRGFDPLSTG